VIGNLTVGNIVGGTATFDTINFPSTGAFAGNVSAGNISTSGQINVGTTLAATGNISSGDWVSAPSATFGDIWGTIRTGNQTIINQVGTLVDLRVSGNILQVGWVLASGGATFTEVTGTLKTNAQPFINSVGTLVDLSVTGNTSTGNISGTTAVFTEVQGTVLTNVQPYITTVGTLTALSVTGNVSSANVTTGNIAATGNISAGTVFAQALVLQTDFGLSANLSAANVVTGNIAASGNITSTGSMVVGDDLQVLGDINTANIVATGITISGGGGGAIDLGSGTLTAGNLIGNITSLNANIYNTTQSDSTTTGALKVAGGVGIGANIYVGGNASVAGNARISTNLSVGGDLTAGNANIGTPDGTNFVFGITNFKGSTLESDNSAIALFTTTVNQIELGLAAQDIEIGALLGNTTINHDLIVGGTIYGNLGNVGLDSNIFVQNNLTVRNSTITGNVIAGAARIGSANIASRFSIDGLQASINSQSGALTVAGGVGIVNSLNVGLPGSANSNVIIHGGEPSTSTTTGVLRVSGGAGVTGNVFAGGVVHITNTYPTTGNTTGALRVTGGASVGGNLNVSGNTVMWGDLTVSGSLNIPSITVAALDGVAVGANIPAAGTFTILGVSQLRPAARPALRLDFANNQKLDRRITFTRNSIGTYVTDTGNLVVASANQPRFTHDGDGQPLGLIIEESRTNLYTKSSEFNHSDWSNIAATPTTTSGSVGPTGSVSNTYRITESATNNFHGVAATTPPTVTLTTKYTASIFAKKGSRTQISLVFDSEGTPTVFDLNYGNISSEGPSYRSTIDSYANGWYRCSSTVQKTNTSGNVTIALANGGAVTYLGDGASYADVYGFQFEEGPYVTTYIPTDTATVTRAADSAVIDGDNFGTFYHAPNGSFLVDAKIGYRPHDLVPQNERNTIISLDDGTTDNRVQIYAENRATPIVYRAANLSVYTAGIQQTNLGQGGNLRTASSGKVAVFYGDSQFGYSFNGNTALQDIVGNVSPSLTRLVIGGGPGTSSLNGTISKIMYYAKVITTSETVTLTQQ
jgi:hypothetical protein